MLVRSNYVILSDAILLSERRWVVQRLVQVDSIVKVVVYTLPVESTLKIKKKNERVSLKQS